ncbi:MAG: PAS domain S-box protein [Gammaproteobacteria bacterium]|nr:MAG: PAS domain S-box protein [Gammaproteobacteria bacterium]
MPKQSASSEPLPEWAEGALQFNRTLLAHATEGIIVVDVDGRVRSFNPAAERIFGQTAPLVLDQDVGELLPDLDPRWPDGHLGRRLAQSERAASEAYELTARRADGTLLDLQLSIAEIDSEGQRHFLGFVRDISELRRLEHQARVHLQELAHLDRLGAVSDLTAGLAHEIAQPLTAVRTNAQACLTMLRSGNVDAAVLEQVVGEIAQQATHAGNIVTQLRAFLHRGESGKFEAVGIAVLVDEVLALLSHEIRRAGVTLVRAHCDPPCELLVNRIQTQQVLANLIKNACEAMTDVDGERRLEVRSLHDRANGSCEIQVADTGPGISAAHLEQIFDPFFTTKSQSLGQGLSICRSIVENHGGSLSAENGSKGGALFRLRMPLCTRERRPDVAGA